MAENWLIRQAKKIDSGKDYAILKNSRIETELRLRLENHFFEPIQAWLERRFLKSKTQNYELKINEQTELDVEGRLKLSLFIMLFDLGLMFYRGTFSLSLSHWTLENTFFAHLYEDNDPKVIFEFLADQRLHGWPPTLQVIGPPDFDEKIFELTVESGYGDSCLDEEYMTNKVREAIDKNIAMNKLVQGGYLEAEDLQPLLAFAEPIYGSSPV